MLHLVAQWCRLSPPISPGSRISSSSSDPSDRMFAPLRITKPNTSTCDYAVRTKQNRSDLTDQLLGLASDSAARQTRSSPRAKIAHAGGMREHTSDTEDARGLPLRCTALSTASGACISAAATRNAAASGSFRAAMEIVDMPGAPAAYRSCDETYAGVGVYETLCQLAAHTVMSARDEVMLPCGCCCVGAPEVLLPARLAIGLLRCGCATQHRGAAFTC